MVRMALTMQKSWREDLHPRNGRGRFAFAPDTGLNPPIGSGVAKQEQIIARLEECAVPMLEVEYSREEYNRFFPEGTAQTPIKTVKMGTDQFAKLGHKDKGKRKSYIGAAYQTLTDPVVIIKEGNDDVYIKSFVNEKGISTFISVEKDKDDDRVIITNYFRRKKEVLKKIKWADSIAYLKDNRGSPAYMDKEGVPHAESSHTSIISRKTLKKSIPRLVIKKSVASSIMCSLEAAYG